ncbi:MAG: hypothetical protein JWQ19_261 [Subtercola sp.]|jgi:hypothetical protein|nr:hypothetical protein [Subtercola sp.]
MTSQPIDETPARKRRRGRAGWVVSVVFAFVYAFAVFGGLSNLIALTQQYASFGVAMPGGALGALIGLVAAPVVIYAIALWGTRRLDVVAATIVYIVGFAVTAVVTLDLQSLYAAALSV